MAESKSNELMERIVSLCKRRGFVFPSSEVYGGINGFWDYGPLGAELKRNVKEAWWRSMTQQRDDVVGLDATIIMHPAVWRASGHVDTFSDPMIDCKTCKGRFRADQIAEIPCPQKPSKCVAECHGEKTEARAFNLMFRTTVGPVESEENLAYLRPETAQAIFVQFKNVLETSRQKVPFGICQVGKAFRNEVTPRNFTFRSREFEQMELEFFIRPDEVIQKLAGQVAAVDPADPLAVLRAPVATWGWEAWHKYWVEERLRWYESIGLPRTSLEEYWQTREELAHYAKATVDILFKFPFGTQELEGIAARGDFDLSQHQKHSGKSMEYFDEEAKAKYIPHVIEPSAGVDRLALALLCSAYTEEEVADEKGRKETRVVLKFHPRIAPVKVGVFPLLKNRPELVERALAIRDRLRPHLSVFYDESGAIGRRYRRQDEAGTPFGVTVDFETLGEAGPELRDTVTLRDRDTMQQTRVRIDDLLPLLLEKIR
ncbi:MAG TPA: glycine--tRNA ligase [Verrucomicrobiota bacterium]|nr:glycine--tRNA ligase [Verrucomicrobiota bacterium]HNU51637.1 glycine--tRNA ligase [Verrucomicrobiota bacterium]